MNKAKLLLILIGIISVASCHAQRYDNNWAYGIAYYITSDTSHEGNGVIDYTNDTFTPKPKPLGITFQVASSYSNAEGHLQLYTNNMWLMDTSQTKIENGDSINYGPYWEHYEPLAISGTDAYPVWHSAMFLPRPDNNDSVIDFFHINNYPSDGTWNATLSRTIIKRKPSERYYVESKNKPISLTKISWGLLSACKHGNGRDWWIAYPSVDSADCIELFLLTPDTLIFWSHTCTGGSGLSGVSGTRALFSTDGSLFVFGDINTGTRVYYFDRCNGIFSNKRTLKPLAFYNAGNLLTDFSIDIALSVNNRFLYTMTSHRLFQTDLNEANIDSNYIFIDSTDGFIDTLWEHNHSPMGWGNAQLGPDGIIHLTTMNWYRFSSPILKPDLKGDSCQFILRGEILPKFWDGGGNTNIPNYRLGRLLGSTCDTIYSDVKPIYAQAPWLKVYPNPASEFVRLDYNWIEWEKYKNIRLEISDITGATVMQMEVPRYSIRQDINVKGLAVGVYSVNLSGISPEGRGTVIAVCKMTKM